MKTLLLGILILLMQSPVFAKTTYLTAAHLIDVKNGKTIKSPLVVIENDKIIKVVSQGEITIPNNAEHIDLAGQTLLPGLMDMHVHLTSDANLHGYKRLAVSLPRSALYGVNSAKATLMAGVTTVRNVGAPGFADVALRDAINDGDIVGPRMYVSGPSLGITGGHCDNNLLPVEYQAKGQGVADGPWQVRAKVRENIKYGADVIKFCATGGVLSKGTKVGAQQYSQEEMDALVAEAKLRGLVTAAHAHGNDGIKAAIKAGVSSIEHASFLDDEAIALAKKHGTYFSMDIYTTEYILGEGEKAGILQESLDKERTVGARQRESFTQAVKAGVKMVFGSDAGVYPHGDNPKQLSRMVRFGMTAMQALQAATINAATLLNKQHMIGSIEVGKQADIIAVKGDPLADISTLESVTMVMKNGVVYKNE
ncbi:amidohydrolase family protein [Aliiglaciecola litoralis]|uniref:Amidohydrolase family protein n=1 Tax=Aliiglaciecola litoralis TaxID=582857 RepID=A0ABP3WNB3_9ALTE